jgi:hypothetical protein
MAIEVTVMVLVGDPSDPLIKLQQTDTAINPRPTQDAAGIEAQAAVASATIDRLTDQVAGTARERLDQWVTASSSGRS